MFIYIYNSLRYYIYMFLQTVSQSLVPKLFDFLSTQIDVDNVGQQIHIERKAEVDFAGGVMQWREPSVHVVLVPETIAHRKRNPGRLKQHGSQACHVARGSNAVLDPERPVFDGCNDIQRREIHRNSLVVLASIIRGHQGNAALQKVVDKRWHNFVPGNLSRLPPILRGHGN